MNEKLERRAYEIEDLVTRQDEGAMKVAGLGVPYNRDSLPIFGMFRERIVPGAFARSLATRDIMMFAQHDSAKLLAKTGNGSLALTDTERGIKFDSTVAPTTDGHNIFTLIEQRLITGMSFAFVTTKERFVQETEDDLPTRFVEEGELIELSPVTFPAYPDSDVAKRAFEEWQTSIINVINDAEVEVERRERVFRLKGVR